MSSNFALTRLPVRYPSPRSGGRVYYYLLNSCCFAPFELENLLLLKTWGLAFCVDAMDSCGRHFCLFPYEREIKKVSKSSVQCVQCVHSTKVESIERFQPQTPSATFTTDFGWSEAAPC